MSPRSLVCSLVLATLAATPSRHRSERRPRPGSHRLSVGRHRRVGRQAPESSISIPKYTADQIIVSFGDRRLYLITQTGKAISYPIAVPREQSRWQGTTTVSEKKRQSVLAADAGHAQGKSQAADLGPGRPSDEPARRARHVPRRQHLPHPRHRRAVDDRAGRLQGLHPHVSTRTCSTSIRAFPSARRSPSRGSSSTRRRSPPTTTAAAPRRFPTSRRPWPARRRRDRRVPFATCRRRRRASRLRQRDARQRGRGEQDGAARSVDRGQAEQADREGQAEGEEAGDRRGHDAFELGSPGRASGQTPVASTAAPGHRLPAATPHWRRQRRKPRARSKPPPKRPRRRHARPNPPARQRTRPRRPRKTPARRPPPTATRNPAKRTAPSARPSKGRPGSKHSKGGAFGSALFLCLR